MTNRLPNMGTLESPVLGFDFARVTGSVSNPTFTVTVEHGTDPSPTTILSGQPQIDSANPANVLQQVIANQNSDGVDYRIQCTAIKADGNPETIACILPIRVKL